MRHGHAIALVAIVVIGGYDLSTSPQRLAQSFAAMRCCAEHCRKGVNMSGAERCCGVAQDQAGVRAVHAAPCAAGQDVPAAFSATVEVTPSTSRCLTWPAGTEPSRAPPLFVVNRTFLL